MTLHDQIKPKRLLWDSQWMNIVNAHDCWRDYSKEGAVHEAVKMAEDAIAKNQAQLALASDARIAELESALKNAREVLGDAAGGKHLLAMKGAAKLIAPLNQLLKGQP